MLDVVKALAALDPAGFGLDDACAQLEGSTCVMADEARPHFCVDRMRQQSYREDLVDATGHPSAVSPDAERLSRRSQSKAVSSFNNQASIAPVSRDHRVRLQVTRFGVGATPHHTLIVFGAPASSRRAPGAPHRITNVCSEFAGVLMEYVEHPDPRPEPISIARCRELLGEDAESMTDQDIEDIRRHAEMMACIVVEMYQEQRRVSE